MERVEEFVSAHESLEVDAEGITKAIFANVLKEHGDDAGTKMEGDVAAPVDAEQSGPLGAADGASSSTVPIAPADGTVSEANATIGDDSVQPDGDAGDQLEEEPVVVEAADAEESDEGAAGVEAAKDKEAAHAAEGEESDEEPEEGRQAGSEVQEAAGEQALQAGEGSGDRDADQQRPEQVRLIITKDEQEALQVLGSLLMNESQPDMGMILNPIIQMDEESFDDQFKSFVDQNMRERPEELELAKIQHTLKKMNASIHRQMRDAQIAARSGAAAGTAGSADAGGDGARAAAPASRGGLGAMPRLPQRSSAGPRGAMVAAGGRGGGRTAAGGRPVSERAPAWEEVWGPEEDRDTVGLRKNLQELRVAACRAFLKLHFSATHHALRSLLYRMLMTERAVAPYPENRPQVDARAESAARQAEDTGAPFTKPARFNVAVFGYRGAGKSALIRRVLGMPPVDAFSGATQRVAVIDGDAFGIPFRFFDGPGLDVGFDAQHSNQATLNQYKRVLKRKANRPHAVLFVDRLDTLRPPSEDVATLRAIGEVLGHSTLFHTAIALTHGCTKAPDAPSGEPLPYETWTVGRQRAVGMALNVALQERTLSQQVCIVESHSRCRTNADGEPVLLSGVAWRPQLLAACVSQALIAELAAVSLSHQRNRRDGQPDQQERLRRMLMGGMSDSVPIPYFLQTFNQPKLPLKFPEDERSVMSPGEIAALKRTDHEAAREEQRRRSEFIMERREVAMHPEPVVPTPAPDPPLPPAFSSLTHNYRYRYNEVMGGWTTRPFVDINGPDGSDGINGAQSERYVALRPPGQHIGGTAARFFMQAVKDKESRTFLGVSEGSAWFGKPTCVTAAAEMQSLGANDMLYTVRAEPRFKWLNVGGSRRMKTSVGLLAVRRGATFKPFRGPMAKGWRAEQRIRVARGLKLIATAVHLRSSGSAGTELGSAHGIEAVLKPLNSLEGFEVSAGYNSMRTARLANGRKLAGNAVQGGTLAMQKNVAPETVVNGRIQLNSGGQSMLGIRITSHDRLQTRWAFLVPLLGLIMDKIFRRSQDATSY